MADNTKAQSVVAHMAATVAAMSSASVSAEALLTATASHINTITDNVDTSDEESVNDALDQLSAFADQLDKQAGELSAAVVANTPAAEDGSAPVSSNTDTNTPTGDGPHPSETISGAAQAGGYSVPSGQASQTSTDDSALGSTVADIDAAKAAVPDGVDSADSDRITSQSAREEAGDFTGTGNQDALRTSDRLGTTDANAADTRTVEGGGGDTPPASDSDTPPQEEGTAADSADAPDAGGQPAA